jgi:hypothetical protein
VTTPPGRGGGLPGRLARINPTVAFFVVLATVLVGLFAPGIVGGAVLLVLAAAVGLLTAATWPVQPPAIRVVRLAVLTALVAAAIAKIV